MTRKNFSDLIISILAFAAICALFLHGQNINGYQGPSHFITEVFETQGGWGYRIRQDSTMVIEQRSILHSEGNQGFQTKKQALATAELVKQKLDNGIFPPVVSLQELDSLGINYR